MDLEKSTITYAQAQLKVDDFWNRGITGRGVKVGIVDHGIGEHEALPIAGGHACLHHDTYYYAAGDHHTHCAGIVLARNLQNGYPCGVAPNADHYVIRMYMLTIETRIKSLIEAIDYAIEEGIDILSVSQAITENSARYDMTGRRTSAMGAPKHLRIPMREAFLRAYRHGVIIVVPASTNSGEINFVELLPKMPNVVVVSHTGYDERPFQSSSDYNWLDVSAPGDNIMSCYAGNKYGRMSGVSMSVPMIAGYLALIRQLYSDKTAQELIEILLANCVRPPELPAKNRSRGIPKPPAELYKLPILDTAVSHFRRYTDYMWQATESYAKINGEWIEMEAMGRG